METVIRVLVILVCLPASSFIAGMMIERSHWRRITAKVVGVIEDEAREYGAREYEARTDNTLRALYLRGRLLPKIWAAFGSPGKAP